MDPISVLFPVQDDLHKSSCGKARVQISMDALRNTLHKHFVRAEDFPGRTFEAKCRFSADIYPLLPFEIKSLLGKGSMQRCQDGMCWGTRNSKSPGYPRDENYETGIPPLTPCPDRSDRSST